MTKNIAVIGAGLAGITVASKIKEKFDVKVFDRKDSPRVKSLFINLKIFIALMRDIFR